MGKGTIGSRIIVSNGFLIFQLYLASRGLLHNIYNAVTLCIGGVYWWIEGLS